MIEDVTTKGLVFILLVVIANFADCCCRSEPVGGRQEALAVQESIE